MSADNWTLCPRCITVGTKTQQANLEKAQKAYGKVSLEEYKKLEREAEKPLVIEDSLREDYEVGMSQKGLFTFGYCCECTTCGFKFTKKIEQQVEIK